jgi:lactoylglutathione lyase
VFDAHVIEELRCMARNGRSVADMARTAYRHSRVPFDQFAVPVIACFREAFAIGLHPLMDSLSNWISSGGTADDELELQLLPLIEATRSHWDFEPVLCAVVLQSFDIQRLAAFYTAVGIGLSEITTMTVDGQLTEPMRYAANVGGVEFTIRQSEPCQEPVRSVNIGFRIHDLDAAILRVTAMGGQILSPVHETAYGRRTVLEDPDGHRVELTDAQ